MTAVAFTFTPRLNRGEQDTRGGNACIEVAGGNGLNDVGSIAEHSLGDRSASPGKVSSGDFKKQRGIRPGPIMTDADLTRLGRRNARACDSPNDRAREQRADRRPPDGEMWTLDASITCHVNHLSLKRPNRPMNRGYRLPVLAAQLDLAVECAFPYRLSSCAKLINFSKMPAAQGRRNRENCPVESKADDANHEQA